MNSEDNLEMNTYMENDHSQSIAQILNLSKENVENILADEFGANFKKSKGFDNLINMLIH